MATRGWWGDKVIITLSSNDEQRNKNWCIHYQRSDKFCSELLCKCVGSAHCEHYEKKPGCGPVDIKVIPQEVRFASPIATTPSTSHTKIDELAYIPGHNPPFGEKLLGKVVLIKNNFGKASLGEVVDENHDYITIEKDNGSIVKYSRKVAVAQKTFWVLDEI